MGKIRRGLGILLMVTMLFSLSAVCFADVSVPPAEKLQSVSASTDDSGISLLRRSCFNRGSATLTQISGRNLAIDVEAYAYHNVDQIGMTIYLEEMRNGVLDEVDSWTVNRYNTDYAEFLTGYTVEGNADYRLYVIFSTKHTADGGGTEGDSAATSWMWID